MSSLRIYFVISAFLLTMPVRSISRFSLTTIHPVSTSSPSARSDHLAVVINSGNGPLLVVHGGRDKNGPKSDTWTYLVSKKQWTLLAPNVLQGADLPPPVYGAVGGYRFVQGKSSPFLYVAFGMSTGGRLNEEMWVMDFETFRWTKVHVDGDVPEARHSSVGSLERFNNPDGSVEPALLISHGYGEKGLLSDTYKCSFNPTDPYHATWRLLKSSVGQHSMLQPHSMWSQASAFTANRDLIVVGGCYASQNTGGKCPHSDVWLLYHKQENSSSLRKELDTNNNDSAYLVEEHHSVNWERAPKGPGPRVGASMSQGLSSFKGAYESYLSTAVMYGGSHGAEKVSKGLLLSSSELYNSELNIFSTQARAWIREHVEFIGTAEEKKAVLSAKTGMSMNIVKFYNSTSNTTDEYYIMFGGQTRNEMFSRLLLQLSFDAFMESEQPEHLEWYISRSFVHGTLMFVSWGIMMVLGICFSRYWRPKERRKRGRILHMTIETLALVAAWIGLAVVRSAREPSNPSFYHARLGMALLALATLQPLMVSIAWLTDRVIFMWNMNRPVNHNYERQTGLPRSSLGSLSGLFAVVHIILGSCILLLGWTNILLGLFLMVSPPLLWIHWISFCVVVIMIFVLVELGRDCGKDGFV